MLLNDYAERLSFDRADTYSFQRGAEYEDELRVLRLEWDALKARQLKKNDLTLNDERRLAWLDQVLSQTQYLTGSDRKFHRSAQKTASFRDGEPFMERLKAILERPQTEINSWMCVPVYRDAVVFYQNDQIVSSLNVCFACNKMEARPAVEIEADDETYRQLRELFLELGHTIDER